MSRRNRQQPPISLFAFQDIITSLSGVIIFMVMTLTLELINRPPTPESSTSSETVARLDEIIATTTNDVESLRKSVEAAADRIGEAAALSPSESQTEIGDIERQTIAVKEETQALESERRTLAERGKELQREQDDKRDARDELAELREEETSRAEELAQERANNRIIYSLPKGFQKDGWLIVVDDRSLSVAPLGAEAEPKSFVSSSVTMQDGRSATEQFSQWVRDSKMESDYFFVLVRPNGISTFDALENGLRSMGCSFGFDLCGQDQTVMHPKLGASE